MKRREKAEQIVNGWRMALRNFKFNKKDAIPLERGAAVLTDVSVRIFQSGGADIEVSNEEFEKLVVAYLGLKYFGFDGEEEK